MYRIEIRKHQIKNKNGDNVTIGCYGTSAEYLLGNNADTSWYDITGTVSNLNDIEFIWDVDEDEGNGKSISLVISGVNEYNLIRDWLYCSPCGALQSFDCRITDLQCGVTYDNYFIKGDNGKFCNDELCTIEIDLRHENEIKKCLNTISIWDNDSGWLTTDVNAPSYRDFPAFAIAFDTDSGGAEFGTYMVWQSFPLVAYASAISSLFVNAINDVFNASISYSQILDTTETFEKIFGLDRFAVGIPLAEIMDNIASRCGLSHSSFLQTDPFSRDCWLEASQGYFHEEKDGSNISGLSNNNTSSANWGYYWNYQIRTPYEFFDIIEKHYNCEVWVENGILHAELNKDRVDTEVLDLSGESVKICTEFSGEKNKAKYALKYAIDDGASGEINPLYSGVAEWGNSNGEWVENPLLDGVETINHEIASTGFVRDGLTEDFLRKGIKRGLTTALLTLLNLVIAAVGLLAGVVSAAGGAALIALGVVWVVVLMAKYTSLLAKYADFDSDYTGIIRIKNQNTITVPRILRWDGQNMNYAKVVYMDNPMPRLPYNSKPYKEVYVLNKDLNNNSLNNGVNNYRAFNYPHYFDQLFKDNLYDLHEPTKNPNRGYISNMIVTLTFCKTCLILSKLGLSKAWAKGLNNIVKYKNDTCFGNRVKVKTIQLKGGIITLTGKLYRK